MPKVDNNISYRTLDGLNSQKQKASRKVHNSGYPTRKTGGLPIAKANTMPKEQNSVVPISNIPDSPEGLDYTNDRDFKVMSLRRRIASLLADKANANDKVTFALTLLVDEYRFWVLGMREDQWETYTQIERRMGKLKGGIEHLLHDYPMKHTMLDELNKLLEREKKAHDRS